MWIGTVSGKPPHAQGLSRVSFQAEAIMRCPVGSSATPTAGFNMPLYDSFFKIYSDFLMNQRIF
jgi:hypothetical protein